MYRHTDLLTHWPTDLLTYWLTDLLTYWPIFPQSLTPASRWRSSTWVKMTRSTSSLTRRLKVSRAMSRPGWRHGSLSSAWSTRFPPKVGSNCRRRRMDRESEDLWPVASRLWRQSRTCATCFPWKKKIFKKNPPFISNNLLRLHVFYNVLLFYVWWFHCFVTIKKRKNFIYFDFFCLIDVSTDL